MLVIILILFGILYSLKQLLRPSTWGIGRKRSERGASPEDRMPTIITILFSTALILSAGLISLLSMRIHSGYVALGEHFDKVATELDSALTVIEGRGRSLHQALISVNDSMIEGYLQLLGTEGNTASQEYAVELHVGLTSTKKLKSRLKKIQRLAQSMGELQLRATSCIPRLKHDYRGGKLDIEADSLHRMVLEWLGSWQKMNMFLMQGATQLESYIMKVAKKFPDEVVDASALKRAIDTDLVKNRKSNVASK